MNFYVVAYNTTKVQRAQVPATYEGFADARWKGRIALEATDAEWMATLIKTWGGDKGMEIAVADMVQLGYLKSPPPIVDTTLLRQVLGSA